MPIFQGRWFNLRVGSGYAVLIDQIEGLARLNPLAQNEWKGYNNTARTPVPISRSTTYELLVRVDSNNG